MDSLLTVKERNKLVAVLRQLDPEAPAEQRREPRRKALINLKIRKISYAKTEPPGKATLINASSVGVGFLTEMALAKGDRFVVSLRFEEGGGWLVLCEVRNAKELPNSHYKIGGQFKDRIEDPQGNAKIPGDWLDFAR